MSTDDETHHESIAVDTATTQTFVERYAWPPRSAFAHTPCYCEENVAHLLAWLAPNASGLLSLFSSPSPSERPLPQALLPARVHLFAVFLSNATQRTPVWRQRAGSGSEGKVCWDYHVIAAARVTSSDLCHHDLVLDLDSTLPFPCDAELYVREALRPHAVASSAWTRTVPAAQFLLEFASDRRHMRMQPVSGGAGWLAPPPKTAPWRGSAADGAHNLERWLKMSTVGEGGVPGHVCPAAGWLSALDTLCEGSPG